MSKNRIHVFSDDALGEHNAVVIADLVRRGELGIAEVAAAARGHATLDHASTERLALGILLDRLVHPNVQPHQRAAGAMPCFLDAC